MDVEGITLSEIRQKDKDYMLPLTCGISKYNKLVNITKKKQTHRCRKLMVTSRKREKAF